ncbi:MAG: chemotaxis protein [Oscillospiraceae bacterium]
MSSTTDKGILLDAGTNEIEIMEFTICNNTFGINVAKVKEILMDSEIKSMPHSHPSVEGVFKSRDVLLTVINLPHYLGLNSDDAKARSLFIVTSFNKMSVAFRVDSVVGINRISWENIEKPDRTIYGGSEGVATGIANYDDRLITILDFEKIISDISPESGIQVSSITKMGARNENNIPIVVVEDSTLLAKMILECLHLAGFTNIIQFNNGEEAWDYLGGLRQQKNITDSVACVITDIEMPRMDGHRLTKLIKSDKEFKVIPVIIFSSLINDEMRRKGEHLGADAQLSKPDIGKLVSVLDQVIETGNK